jgi:hypothetical protein
MFISKFRLIDLFLIHEPVPQTWSHLDTGYCWKSTAFRSIKPTELRFYSPASSLSHKGGSWGHAASCTPVLDWALYANPWILIWYCPSDLHITENDLTPESTTQLDPVLSLRGLHPRPVQEFSLTESLWTQQLIYIRWKQNILTIQ